MTRLPVSLALLLVTSSLATLATLAMPAHADVPSGVRATAARAEAEAFAALEENRDCDAARSFLRAHDLAPDGRLVVNAALALERNGSRGEALALFRRMRGTPAGIVADVDTHIAALERDVRAHDGGAACTTHAERHALNASDTVDVDADVAAPDLATSGYLPMGIAAFAGGVVVAGATMGTFAWLELGVIQNAQSTGDAKVSALGARDPVLWAGGTVASALVVAGAVLVPLSFVEEPQ